MATKKDLVEAQAFSRRRLTTAFVSGAPGGREVEPQRPMRAVIGGVALSVLLVVGGLAAGYLKPSLPSGWDDNSLVIAKKSGARFVALKGTLYPVINTTSARLLIAPNSFRVVTVDDDKITDTPRGATVGILGAPDSLPGPDALVGTGWTACVGRSGSVALTVGADAPSSAGRQAAVVRSGGDLFVVTGSNRLPVPDKDATAVLRALRLDTVSPTDVPASWVDLFPVGPSLTPLSLDGLGRSVPGLPPNAAVGSVLTVKSPGAEPRRYLVTPQGELAPLSPFAYALYLLGSGQAAPPEVDVTPAEIGQLPTSRSSIVPSEWPQTVPTPLDGTPCVTLDAARQQLPTVALTDGTTSPTGGGVTVRVAAGGGALVRGVASNVVDRGPVVAVDQTGTAYGIPDGSADTLARLGYTEDDVTPVPQAWLDLFRPGPDLTSKAAFTPVAGG